MNTNVLKNFFCPQCGQSQALGVLATVRATVLDDGLSDHSDPHWDDTDEAWCPECGHRGIAQDFFKGTPSVLGTLTAGTLLVDTPEGCYYTGPLEPGKALGRDSYFLVREETLEDGVAVRVGEFYPNAPDDDPNAWGTSMTGDFEEAWRYFLGTTFGPIDEEYDEEALRKALKNSVIRRAAVVFLHSEDPESIDLTALALALGEDPADVEAIQKDTKPRHVSFYASQDLPVDGGTWSVFREFYLTADHEEPIDDLTSHVSTHPNEDEADAEVNRLYAEHQPCVAAGHHLSTQRHIRIECAAHPGKTYDHEAAPDSMPGPGETCKTCGEDLTWNGPGQYNYLHVDDALNR